MELAALARWAGRLSVRALSRRSSNALRLIVAAGWALEITGDVAMRCKQCSLAWQDFTKQTRVRNTYKHTGKNTYIHTYIHTTYIHTYTYVEVVLPRIVRWRAGAQLQASIWVDTSAGQTADQGPANAPRLFDRAAAFMLKSNNRAGPGCGPGRCGLGRCGLGRPAAEGLGGWGWRRGSQG